MPKYLLKPTFLNSSQAMTVSECCSSLGKSSRATHGFHSNWEVNKAMKAAPTDFSIYVRCILNNASLACLNREKLELIPGVIYIHQRRSKGVKDMIPDTDIPIFILGRKVEKRKGKKIISKSYTQRFWKVTFIPPNLKITLYCKNETRIMKKLFFHFPWGLFLNTL